MDSKPCESYDIEWSNLECAGNTQKRLGTRLQNKVEEYNTANKKNNGILPDRKTLSSKGKLTEKVKNSMQNYYGLAIKNNKNQLFTMKKNIGVVLYHCTALANETVCHQFWHKGEEGWCK